MKKNLQIHVRVTPATRKHWDEICDQSNFNTQSALFRELISELYVNKYNEEKQDGNKN